MARKSTVRSSASEVRAWAVANGHPVFNGGDGKAVRGRLPKATVALFDEAHPNAPYGTAKSRGPVLVEVSAKPAKGRTVKRKVSIPAVRAWAQANGHTSATKGRLSQNILTEYVLSGQGK